MSEQNEPHNAGQAKITITSQSVPKEAQARIAAAIREGKAMRAHELEVSPLDLILEKRKLESELFDLKAKLAEDLRAVLGAINAADLGGAILWLEPPYVLPGVHETASERLEEVIERLEKRTQ